MTEMGPWDGERASLPDAPESAADGGDGSLALATWKLMLDRGSMQDGEKYLRATARTPVCRVSPDAYAAKPLAVMETELAAALAAIAPGPWNSRYRSRTLARRVPARRTSVDETTTVPVPRRRCDGTRPNR